MRACMDGRGGVRLRARLVSLHACGVRVSTGTSMRAQAAQQKQEETEAAVKDRDAKLVTALKQYAEVSSKLAALEAKLKEGDVQAERMSQHLAQVEGEAEALRKGKFAAEVREGYGAGRGCLGARGRLGGACWAWAAPRVLRAHGKAGWVSGLNERGRLESGMISLLARRRSCASSRRRLKSSSRQLRR